MLSTRFNAAAIPPALMVATTFLLGSPGAKANLLVNPSFEAVTVPNASPWYLAAGTGNTPGWTQTGSGVDTIRNGFIALGNPTLVPGASNGVNFLDMNGAAPRSNGGIFQVVNATIGLPYTLTFDAAAWIIYSLPCSTDFSQPPCVTSTILYELYDPSTSTVLNSGTFTDIVGSVWTQQSLLATATSDSIGVRITSTSAALSAMGVDNVSLTAPAPGPLPLLGVTAAFSWSRRLRSRQRRSTLTV